MACNRQYGNAWWLKRSTYYNYNLTITTIARSNIFNVQIRSGSWWCCVFLSFFGNHFCFWDLFSFENHFPILRLALSTDFFTITVFYSHKHTHTFAHSNTSRYRIDVQFQKIESIHRDRRKKNMNKSKWTFQLQSSW